MGWWARVSRRIEEMPMHWLVNLLVLACISWLMAWLGLMVLVMFLAGGDGGGFR
jgi:hypothetical protein